MPKKLKLGAALLKAMEDVVALMEVTHDPERLEELDELRVKLSRQHSELVDARLDASTAKYKKATRGLQDASATIQQAIRGLESVAKAIALVGKALDLAAKVAAV